MIYITILRDPVDRVLSHYYYLRGRMDAGSTFSDRSWLQEAARMSLPDCVRYGRSADLRNGLDQAPRREKQGWAPRKELRRGKIRWRWP